MAFKYKTNRENLVTFTLFKFTIFKLTVFELDSDDCIIMCRLMYYCTTMKSVAQL